MPTTRIGPTVWRIGLHAAALAATLLVLWKAARFLELAVISLIFAAALESPVAWLVGRGWRRGLAIVGVVLATVVALGGVLALLVPHVAPQLQSAASAAPDLLSDAQDSAAMRWAADHDLVQRGLTQLRQHVGTAVTSLFAAAAGVLSFGAGVVTVAALTVFLLASGPAAWAWIVEWVRPGRRPRVRRVASGARRAVAGYVAGALAIGTIAGVVTAVTTGLLGVPFYLALAVVTALLGIVPFIGAIVSGILVVLTTLATAGVTAAAIALAVFVAYQQLEGAVLQPFVQRYATSLNPLLVLFAVLLGMSALGIFGGVVAVPFAAAGKVVANDALERRRRSWGARDRSSSGGEATRAPASPAEAHH